MKLELCLAICLTIVSCVIFQSQPQSKPHPKADIVYFNGPIITMNEKHKFASFVAVAAGKIIHVGKFHSHIHKFVAKNTTLINLHGKTIIPGFIDSHSHFSLTAIKLGQGFDLSPPPFGSVTSIAQIVENIKGYISQNNIPAGKIIYGLGYSDIDLIEHRHPSRYDLDAASTVNPICIRHFSNHILACNSLALAEVGYTDDTPNPPGG
jgi:predicted amidohydrolase YtcJ